jgi:dTDP-4-dehydrorhamnose 3,5-epimerase
MGWKIYNTYPTNGDYCTMKFETGSIKGVYEILPEPIMDKRGFFARSFCNVEFLKYGLETKIVEQSISYNKKMGTFRGMHYQEPPYEEAKIVSCFNGSIFDIIVDMRPNSPTYKKWEAHILVDSLYNSIYVPKGCAHGFQSLKNNTVVHYSISEPYMEGHSKTVCYKKFGIMLPLEITAISDRDDCE